MLKNIKWLGHAGFKISGQKVVYIDPFKISESETADIIIITHDHFDHYSPEDIEKIRGKNTIMVATKDTASKLSGNIKPISIGDSLEIEGINIEAVPAYNLNKNFHPKGNSWIGVVITVNNQRIYHAGDTDLIPEMNYLKNIDIALLPVSGTYVMTAEEAAEAANKIMPKVAVPMHYDNIVGTIADAEKFKRLCSCKVKILR
jgi:L-ascorbate metabolism protein UlaG (beta-lactamase superfamily)